MRSLRGTVVHEPARHEDHVCGPGWEWSDGESAEPGWPSSPAGFYWCDPWDVPLGTVVECDCGQTWVCYQRPEEIGRWWVSMARNAWRKETRRERKRQARRSVQPDHVSWRTTRWPTSSTTDRAQDER